MLSWPLSETALVVRITPTVYTWRLRQVVSSYDRLSRRVGLVSQAESSFWSIKSLTFFIGCVVGLASFSMSNSRIYIMYKYMTSLLCAFVWGFLFHIAGDECLIHSSASHVCSPPQIGNQERACMSCMMLHIRNCRSFQELQQVLMIFQGSGCCSIERLVTEIVASQPCITVWLRKVFVHSYKHLEDNSRWHYCNWYWQIQRLCSCSQLHYIECFVSKRWYWFDYQSKN